MTGIRLVPAGRALAAAAKLRPGKLKVTKRRTPTSLDVRITRLRRGTLKLKIVARRLEEPTRVTAKIRQSKRG